jgi:hypothetical protein
MRRISGWSCKYDSRHMHAGTSSSEISQVIWDLLGPAQGIVIGDHAAQNHSAAA